MTAQIPHWVKVRLVFFPIWARLMDEKYLSDLCISTPDGAPVLPLFAWTPRGITYKKL